MHMWTSCTYHYGFNIFCLLNISIMYVADDVDASTFPSAHLSAPKAEVHGI